MRDCRNTALRAAHGSDLVDLLNLLDNALEDAMSGGRSVHDARELITLARGARVVEAAKALHDALSACS